MSVPVELLELMREIAKAGKVIGELRGQNEVLREQNERLYKLLEQQREKPQA